MEIWLFENAKCVPLCASGAVASNTCMFEREARCSAQQQGHHRPELHCESALQPAVRAGKVRNAGSPPTKSVRPKSGGDEAAVRCVRNRTRTSSAPAYPRIGRCRGLLIPRRRARVPALTDPTDISAGQGPRAAPLPDGAAAAGRVADPATEPIRNAAHGQDEGGRLTGASGSPGRRVPEWEPLRRRRSRVRASRPPRAGRPRDARRAPAPRRRSRPAGPRWSRCGR